MKRLFVILSALTFFAVSCEEDNDSSDRNHDNNPYMAIMHEVSESMDSLEMTMDPDHDFAMMMIEHHKGAIRMGERVIKEGNDSTIVQLARKMNEEQMEEIEEMESFLEENDPDQEIAEFNPKMMTVMEIMQDDADLQRLEGDPDHDFSILMIQHHQAAIDMSELELRYGNEDEMKEMAVKTIEMQREEIKKLQDWLLDQD